MSPELNRDNSKNVTLRFKNNGSTQKIIKMIKNV